jgi:hypothetical protein
VAAPERHATLRAGIPQPRLPPGDAAPDLPAVRALDGAALALEPDPVTGPGPARHRLPAARYSSGTKTDTRGSGPTSRVM